MTTYFKSFTILFFVSFISCNVQKEDKKEQTPIYCKYNLDYLFSVNDSIPKFEIDYSQDKDSIFDFIESHFENDSCWHNRSFGLIMDTNTVVKINYSKSCSSDYYIACGRGYRYNTVFRASLNSQGELLMEGEISEPNQIAHAVFNKFANQNFPHVFSIIKWKSNTPTNTIKHVLTEIIRGYSLCYTKLAHDIFNKELHQLNTIQMDSLTKIIPFDVKLLEIERNKFIHPPVIVPELTN